MNAPPAPYPLYGRVGDTLPVTITWTNPDNTPIDLTGCTLEFSLRGRNITRQYLTPPEVVLTNAAAGVIDAELTPADTRDLGAGAFQYEITVTFPSGRRTTILDGQVFLAPEVIE